MGGGESGLTGIVVTPALCGSIVEDGAGVGTPSPYRGCGPFISQVYLHGSGAIGGGPVSQLSDIVFAPTHKRTVIQDGTGMFSFGVDGGGGSVASESHGDGRIAGGGTPIPHLPGAVGPPALDGFVVEDSAAVIASGTDCGGGLVRPQIHFSGSIPVGGASESQLSGAVISPAPNLVVVQDSAGVGSPGTDFFGGFTPQVH